MVSCENDVKGGELQKRKGEEKETLYNARRKRWRERGKN